MRPVQGSTGSLNFGRAEDKCFKKFATKKERSLNFPDRFGTLGGYSSLPQSLHVGLAAERCFFGPNRLDDRLKECWEVNNRSNIG